jgi:site-specific DNA recombinase
VAVGYRYVQGEGRIEPVDGEAYWVARMFEWLVEERMTLRGIATRLNEEGVPTKHGAPRWTTATVRYILRNPIYMGEFAWSKSSPIPGPPANGARGGDRHDHRGPRGGRGDRSHRRKRNPPEEWVRVKVPAVVSREMFEAAQAQLTRNKEVAARNLRDRQRYLLRGMLVCAQCNRRLVARLMTNRPGGRKDLYQYYCSGRLDPALRPGCRTGWLTGPALEDAVWEKVRVYLRDRKRIERSLQLRGRQADEDRVRQDAELARLATEERTVQVQTDKLLGLLYEGRVDDATFDRQMGMLRKRAESMAARRSTLDEQTRQREHAAGALDQVKELCEVARGAVDLLNRAQRRRLLEMMDLRGRVDGNRVELEGLFTDEATPFFRAVIELHKETRRRPGDDNGNEPTQGGDGQGDGEGGGSLLLVAEGRRLPDLPSQLHG